MTEVSENGVCAVLCCVAGVWEDDVVASPSPAGGGDANTASDEANTAIEHNCSDK